MKNGSCSPKFTESRTSREPKIPLELLMHLFLKSWHPSYVRFCSCLASFSTSCCRLRTASANPTVPQFNRTLCWSSISLFFSFLASISISTQRSRSWFVASQRWKSTLSSWCLERFAAGYALFSPQWFQVQPMGADRLELPCNVRLREICNGKSHCGDLLEAVCQAQLSELSLSIFSYC